MTTLATKPTTFANDGDTSFLGVDMRDPRTLRPGMLNDGENLRFDNLVPETRKGVIKPPWANKVDASASMKVNPWGTIYGVGVFRDPNSLEWLLIAADGLAWRTRPYNQPVSVPLPTGVKLISGCTFVQAFDKVYCLRGKFLAPLRLSSFDNGFEDLVTQWNASDTFSAGTEVAYGPFQNVTSITRVGGTATVITAAAHGLITGADVTIRSATQAAYNGRKNIVVIDDVTFTFSVSGNPATPATTAGTITVSNMIQYWKAGGGGGNPSAGDSPDSAATKWTRVYNILPNADNALYVNNRLLVPTAYEPSSADNYATFNGGSYKKKDYIVATDYLDDIHFDFSNEFRINQGSEDEIVDLLKLTEDTVFVSKGSSWGILTGVRLDLSQLKLDLRSKSYGQSARGACVLEGNNAFFVSNRRGVVSIRQSENGKFMSVDVPLSAPIQKLIDRIDWTLSAGIRMNSWNNKLYTAAPIDSGAKVYGADMVATNSTAVTTVPFNAGPAATWVTLVSGFVPGQRYLYTPGNSMFIFASYTYDGSILFSGLNTGGEFIATQSSYYLYSQSRPTTALLQPVFTGVNNALLVHDFVLAARGGNVDTPQGDTCGWTPADRGSALSVKEFVRLKVDNVERLLFASGDGYLNLLEECDAGDQVGDPTSSTGLKLEPISTRQLSRAYHATFDGHGRPVEATLVLQTLNPKYSARVIFDGVNKSTTLTTDETRDPVKYFRPWDATDWDPTNANDDHGTRYREDYSVFIPNGGLNLGSGIALNQFQEALETFRPAGRQGRSFQVEVTNTQGRIKLLGIRLGTVDGRKRKGPQV